jgi:hypothetical protein
LKTLQHRRLSHFHASNARIIREHKSASVIVGYVRALAVLSATRVTQTSGT